MRRTHQPVSLSLRPVVRTEPLEARQFLSAALADEPVTMTLHAEADAYVRDGGFADTNFGAAPQLQVKRGSAGYTRDAYLRFDLRSLTAPESATLRVFGQLDNTLSASSAFTVHYAAGDAWGESQITWNTRPPAGTTALGSATVVGRTGNWYDVDLTAFVKQLHAAGDNFATLVLKTSSTSNSTILLGSDESANRPALLVTEGEPPPQAILLDKSQMTVNEDGANSAKVHLAARPSSDVVVAVTKEAGGDPDLVIDKTSLVFTPDNWNTPQSVTVRAAQDADTTDGTATFTFSSDALPSKTLAATEADNDVPPPPAEAVTVLADHATFVRDGSFADTNYGSDRALQAKTGSAGYTRESYIRFDLTSLPEDVGSATLQVLARLDNTKQSSVTFGVFTSGNTTWDENAVTWNSRLASGTTPLDTDTVSEQLSYRLKELDVTEYVRQQKAAGATAVTFVLKTLAVGNSTVLFGSDESSLPPQLVVTPAD